ncbi:MAG: phosphatidic acid phosphatase [Oscillospiraceae bacterium]|nr:phosphatidic acid phosphatase [Oscillospiraceae bacterium]
MRKPTVDYSGFRLSRLAEPRFRHLLLLLGWVGYFVLYALTENLIPAEKCTPVHIFLDDIIPFCEWFVIPYVFWYVLIVISLGYFMFYDVDSFRRLQIFIMITQAVAMVCYILFPTRQDLRPEFFPRENLLTALVGVLYHFDTNTGVCPSLHVAYSLGIASVWLKQKDAAWMWKAFVVVAVVLICLSTAFIKQHSAADIFAALPLGLLAEALVYGKSYWLPRLRRSARK